MSNELVSTSSLLLKPRFGLFTFPSSSKMKSLAPPVKLLTVGGYVRPGPIGLDMSGQINLGFAALLCLGVGL